ncbi:MAG: hypothetical protein JWO82_1703 [Akkermansiaceae bacterium]|nr:hypothetical protein [Akkermansiaceae bacterium]
MKTRTKVIAGSIALFVSAFIVINHLNWDLPSNVISSVPADAQIIEKYQSNHWGNGDFLTAVKIRGSLQDYLKMAAKHPVDEKVHDPLQSIGYDVGKPLSTLDWWDEPKDYERKSWGKEARFYTRITYGKGFIYFVREGW